MLCSCLWFFLFVFVYAQVRFPMFVFFVFFLVPALVDGVFFFKKNISFYNFLLILLHKVHTLHSKNMQHPRCDYRTYANTYLPINESMLNTYSLPPRRKSVFTHDVVRCSLLGEKKWI